MRQLLALVVSSRARRIHHDDHPITTMVRLSVIGAMSAALVLPASAAAYPRFRANAGQREAIEQSAKATQPCGYHGDYRHLRNFRTTLYRDGRVTLNFAQVRWAPSPEGDSCQLVFVNTPGYTLKSYQTTKHAFVRWVPLTWGSSPFDSPSSLSQTLRRWTDAMPPNWLAIARALS